jgi:hypothetical protein
MARKARSYVTPVVTSFSESEVMDLLGVATTYPGTPDSISSPDPSSGGSGSKPGDPKKAHK